MTHLDAPHRVRAPRALFAALGGLTVLYLAYLAGLPVGPADGLFARWLGMAVEVGAAVACVA
jgi:hypothetical protein